VPVLDGFRAFAIFGVVAVHLLLAAGALDATTATTERVLVWGAFGNLIDIFFIVSGFVIFLPVVIRGGELGGLWRYALARGSRLFPAYWASLAVVMVLLALAPPDPRPLGLTAIGFPNATEIAAHLPAMHWPARLFNGGFEIGFGANGPLWMVSVIVGFYIVLPFIARSYFRHPLIGLALAAALTVAWKEAALHETGFFESVEGHQTPAWIVELIVTEQLPGWAFSFALGMTGAWAYVRLKASDQSARLVQPAAWIALVAVLAYAGLAYLYGREATEVTGAVSGSHARLQPALAIAFSSCRAVLLAAIILGPAWLQRPFDNRPTRRLSELSYAVYLIHIPIAIWVGGELLDLSTAGTIRAIAAWFAVVIPLSLAYAALSRRFVEEPARRWARRHSSALPRAGKPAPVAATSPP
jgi:peptidoglycan/LPS O-acetylase OafA/YrhL